MKIVKVIVKMNNERKMEYWRDWVFRSKGYSCFPYEVSPPGMRTLVGDFNSFYYLMDYFSTRANCYMSLYPVEMREFDIIDCIWFDIDYHSDFYNRVNEAVAILDRFFESEGIPYRRIFTGYKGVHYYILVKPMVLNRPAIVAERFLEWLPKIPRDVKPIGDGLCGSSYRVLSGYDKTFGDLSSMTRVPLTKNMCTMCDAVECYSRIEFLPELEIREWEVSNKMSKMLLEFDNMDTSLKYEAYEKMDVDLKWWAPCIFRAIDLLSMSDMNGDALISHEQARHLASFLFWAGVGEDDIVRFFEIRPDYNEKKTRYQVRDIIRRKLLPNKCEGVIQMGLCNRDIAKSCLFYPFIIARMKEIGVLASQIKI